MAARLTAYVVVAIVGATLIAGLIVGAQRDDSDGPVDLIVHNARVYTADGRGTLEEAVAIRGNQILRVGGEREILRLRRPQTTLIDARGGTVLPGFNDAHVRILDGGLSLDGIDLLGATTPEQAYQQISAWAGTNPDSPWVIGRGWQYGVFPGGLPNRQQLDAIVSTRPALLYSSDGHTAWVNTAALRRAGLTRSTADPEGGVIVKDSRTGEPTGALMGTAVPLVSRLVPAAAPETRARALRAAIAEAHAHGITSLQNAAANPDDLGLFEEAHRTGDLDVRVYSALAVGTTFGERERDRLLAASRRHPDDPVFKTGAVTIALDGAIGAHTAALLAPYADRLQTGDTSLKPDDLNRIVRLIDREGWQVMTQATGDRAVRMTLDAYEHAARSNPAPERGRRHRIEHAELVDPLDVPRFRRLGVLASMQPFQGSPSAMQTELWSRALGPERTRDVWPYQNILAAGGRLAFGSGWPAAPLNPLLGIQAAVTRMTPEGLTESGWSPAQRMALEAALDAYTSGGAWASFDELRKGMIASGMLADLVVLSDDIFEAPPSALARTRIAVTIFDGTIVYRGDMGTN